MGVRVEAPGVVMPRIVSAAFVLLCGVSLAGCKIVVVKSDRGGGQADAAPAAQGGDPAPSAPAPTEQRADGGARSRYAPDERGAPVHDLGSEYLPLRRIVGTRAFPFQSETTITTIGDACYTPDLEGWLQRHPPGGPVFTGTLSHERVHAQRQAAYPGGVDAWIERYLNDGAFMWDEESRGWYEELRYLLNRRFTLSAAAVGRSLSGYSNLRGSMISQAEGQRWAEDVIAGRWRPQ